MPFFAWLMFRLTSHWKQFRISGSSRIGNDLPVQAHPALDNSLPGDGAQQVVELEVWHFPGALPFLGVGIDSGANEVESFFVFLFARKALHTFAGQRYHGAGMRQDERVIVNRPCPWDERALLH